MVVIAVNIKMHNIFPVIDKSGQADENGTEWPFLHPEGVQKYSERVKKVKRKATAM